MPITPEDCQRAIAEHTAGRKDRRVEILGHGQEDRRGPATDTLPISALRAAAEAAYQSLNGPEYERRGPATDTLPSPMRRNGQKERREGERRGYREHPLNETGARVKDRRVSPAITEYLDIQRRIIIARNDALEQAAKVCDRSAADALVRFKSTPDDGEREAQDNYSFNALWLAAAIRALMVQP